MPSFPILEQVLVVDRQRQRVSERRGGASVPALGRQRTSPEHNPFLVTNARGQFVLTRPASDGYVNYGFSLSPNEDMDELLQALYRAILQQSSSTGWQTRCTSVAEGITRLRQSGSEPRSVVLPKSLLREVCGEEVPSVESGYVTTLEQSIRVFVAGLPDGAGIVMAAPPILGMCTRIGDYVGIVLPRANRTMMVIGHGVA